MTAAADPLAWVGEELARLDREGLRRPTRVCRTLPGGRVEIDGRELWNFGSNDYLGLVSDPDVTPRPRGASALPHGATASPAVTGRSPEVAELERTLAEFEGTEDAVVFPTGYAANLGTVAALTSPGDAVFVERDCHACLVDGAKLGGGRLRVIRRKDFRRMRGWLRNTSDAPRRWIVTDGVFSMDGDVAPLGDMLRLARQWDAVVICDEAHGTGVYGQTGRGVAEEHRLLDQPRLVRTGTLSKAVGTAGGFVSGSRDLCGFLRHKAKSHIFSTALPPVIAALATERIRSLPSLTAERVRVRTASRALRERLWAATDPDRVLGRRPGDCPIVPVVVGTPDAAVAASAALADAGFFVPAIRPPTVPRGTSRLRVSLSAAHPDHAVDGLADALISLLKDAA